LDLSPDLNSPDLNAVRRFATAAHGGQRYGDQPYTIHLAAVVDCLSTFGITDPVILAAGWLHDVVEDTDTTLAEVAEVAGDAAAVIVDAVTDGEGDNRKARKARPYRLIPTVAGALEVKLADRIANVTSAASRRPVLFKMYRREHKTFRNRLYRPGHVVEMWAHLDALLS
jgi:(p)ppGpp synthase/HD superfamily hydrolase